MDMTSIKLSKAAGLVTTALASWEEAVNGESTALVVKTDAERLIEAIGDYVIARLNQPSGIDRESAPFGRDS